MTPVLVAAALLVTGCATTAPGASESPSAEPSTSPAPSASESTSPSPSASAMPTPTEPAERPSACADLFTAEDLAAFAAEGMQLDTAAEVPHLGSTSVTEWSRLADLHETAERTFLLACRVGVPQSDALFVAELYDVAADADADAVLAFSDGWERTALDGGLEVRSIDTSEMLSTDEAWIVHDGTWLRVLRVELSTHTAAELAAMIAPQVWS